MSQAAQEQTFKSVNSSNTTYVKAKDLKEGDIIVTGILISANANLNYPEKLDYRFKLEDGSEIVVNQSGNLKPQMDKVSLGSLCRITYGGMSTIQKGPRKGKLAHNYEVEVAG